MTKLRISAKTLGELALSDFCPRCFWLKLRARQLSFQIFPGIFSSIDAYTKRVVYARGAGVKSCDPTPGSSRF